jgi:hypothetical protein
MDPLFRQPFPWIFCVVLLKNMKIHLENYLDLSRPFGTSRFAVTTVSFAKGTILGACNAAV